MSKGEIISHIGEGKYRVRQKLAVERIQQEVTRLSERIAQLAIDLPTAQLELLQAENAVKDKVRDIDLLIPDYRAGVEGARAAINKLQAELVPLQSAAKQAQLRVSELTAENLSALKRRNQLESVPDGRELDAWCADYTLDLTGDVGLVDVNDEGGQGVVIQPGYDGEGAYDQARDGAMFPGLAQSGIQLYFNAAILPGVQKWMPRYRIGTISNIESDTCTVELDEATSSVQDLPINHKSVLQSVPIKYMDCNGAAFEDGDRVLVRYTVTGPLVVGFAENPKSCGNIGFAFIPSGLGTPRRWWGGPFFQEDGSPINPPLGTAMGQNPSWFLRPEGTGWTINKGNESLHGRRNWLGIGEDDILSWDGPVSRAFNSFDYDRLPSEGWLSRTAPSDKVYCQGRVLLTTTALPGGHQYVRGAALRRFGESLELMVVVADGFESNEEFQFWAVPLSETVEVQGAPQLLETFSPTSIPGTYYSVGDWYFNASGDRAVWTFSEARDFGSFLAPGNKTFVARWSVYGSATEAQLYDSRDSWGSNYRQFNSAGGTTSGTRVSLLRPIYADYVGDAEKIAYYETQGYTSNSSVSYSEYYRTDVSPNEQGQSHTLNSTTNYVGSHRLVTGDGMLILDLPDAANSVTNESGNWDLAESLTGSSSVSSSSDYSELLNIYSIDLRFQFATVRYRRFIDSASGSGSPGFGSQGEIRYEMSGNKLSETDVVILGTFGGDILFEVPVIVNKTVSSNWVVAPYVLPAPDGGTTTNVEMGISWFATPEGMWDCCGIRSRGRTAVSVWILDLDADPVLLPDNRFNFQKLSGYGDVIDELFDRAGEEMTMYSLTAI